MRQILAWARAHLAKHGRWPNMAAGAVDGVPDETWLKIDAALRCGCRGLPGGTSLVFVLNPEQDRAELVRQCLNVGYDELLGELEGGVDAWRAAGLPMATVRLVAATAEPAPLTLDVRQRSEYLTAHMVDSMHVELGSLPQLAADLPRGAITTYCGHGERAMTAASLLERAGHRDVSVIEGGLDAWQRMGRPVEAGD